MEYAFALIGQQRMRNDIQRFPSCREIGFEGGARLDALLLAAGTVKPWGEMPRHP